MSVRIISLPALRLHEDGDLGPAPVGHRPPPSLHVARTPLMALRAKPFAFEHVELHGQRFACGRHLARRERRHLARQHTRGRRGARSVPRELRAEVIVYTAGALTGEPRARVERAMQRVLHDLDPTGFLAAVRSAS